MYLSNLKQLGGTLLAAANAANQRRVLVLSGEVSWARDICAQQLDPLLENAALWVGASTPPGWIKCAPREGRMHLGREYKLICLDTFSGFDPDSFGALAGTLIGGGLLCLLCPPLEEWADYADPERKRLCVYPMGPDAVGRRFISRLGTILSNAPGVCVLHQDGRLTGDLNATKKVFTPAHNAGDFPDNYGCINDEQRSVVLALLRAARGHRYRPVVVTAHRGRGKSAAFGLAAAKLITEHETVIITGPSLKAVESVFDHAAAQLPYSSRQRTRLLFGSGCLQFIAPDALECDVPAARLVLVDEAATLPQALLKRLIKVCPRLAFTSTVHGYEGSGRAFAMRFEQYLDVVTPGWRKLILEHPIRWANNDPLEALSFSALLLDAEPATGEVFSNRPFTIPDVEKLDRDKLVEDESLLREVFGLLVLAHYRTRPLDLRQMIDGPTISVWIMRLNGHVAGVALIAEEGGLPQGLTLEIGQGRRRVKGHLLPQVLANHCGCVDAAALRGWRVVRLAMHPNLRRNGLGSALIEQLATEAGKHGLDWLGASFGVTKDLLAFWLHNKMLPLRVGVTREASSGSHSVLVLRPLSSAAQTIQSILRRHYHALLPQLLGDTLRDIEPLLAIELLRTFVVERVGEFGLVGEKPWFGDIGDFAHGFREYEDTLGGLWWLVVNVIPQSAPVTQADTDEIQFACIALVMKVLQKHSWESVANRLGIPGRRQVVALMRKAVKQFLLD